MCDLDPYVVQINVFLRITGKREDGYHDLASLFHVSLSKFQLFDGLLLLFELWTQT